MKKKITFTKIIYTICILLFGSYVFANGIFPNKAQFTANPYTPYYGAISDYANFTNSEADLKTTNNLSLVATAPLADTAGDYKSNGTGGGDWTNLNSWLYYDGSSWATPTAVIGYPGENTGTNNVTIEAGDTITINSNINITTGDIIVNGTLTLDPGSSPWEVTLNTTSLSINGAGAYLNFSGAQAQLNLPSTAALILQNGGDFSGSCTPNNEIFIGPDKYAACRNPGPNTYTFGDIAAAGGTINAEITNPISLTLSEEACDVVALEGGYSGTGGASVNFAWVQRDPNGDLSTIASGTLSGSLPTNSTSTSFTPTIVGEYIISLEVTDGTFTNIETRTFNVSDTTPPTFTVAADQDVNMDASCQITIPDVTGSDSDCSGVTVTQSPAAGTMVAATHNTTIDVTVTAVDDAGNNAAASQTVTLTPKDVTPPTISCPGNTSINTSDDSTGNCTVNYSVVTPTYSDNCSVTLSWTMTGVVTDSGTGPVGSYTFPIGETTINYTVTDGATLTATCSQEITVVDNEVPSISCPPTATGNTSDDSTGNCTTTVYLGTPTATDNCTASGNIIFTAKVGGTTINTTTYLFPIGNTTVVWTATDQNGNTSAPCNQTVTVTDDENPTISCPSNISINTSDDGTGNCTVNYAVVTPTYGDNCSGATLSWTMTGVVTDSGTGPVGSYTFPIGETTINYTVTDGASLTATCSQEITVVDDENPSISCPGDQNVNFDTNCQFTLADYTSMATTSDNCDSDVSVTQSPAPGSLLSASTQITLTATDDSGRTNFCTFNVVPSDNIAPVANCKSITATLSANGTVNIAALDLDNGSTDNCGIANMTVSPNSFNCDDVGDNTVTFTVFDDTGLSDSCIATVTVVDNTKPTMQCNNYVVVIDAITREATIDASDIDNGSNDACGITSLTVSPNVFTEDPNGNVYTTTVTLTATDVNGNFDTCTATVTVEPPKHQETYLVGEIVDPIPDNPQPPSALIEATACPGGLNEPKDVQFNLQAIAPYVLNASDVNYWEYSDDYGETWTTASPNGAGQLTYTMYNITSDRFVRLNITDNSTTPPTVKTSAEAYVRFLPPDEPPIVVSQSAQSICLGESVTIVAESFFDQPNGQFGEGGEFNYAQPDGWRVDGQDGEFPASGNNTDEPTWKESNSNSTNRDFSGINYDTDDNSKFAMANGVGNYTTLETPVFSTVGMTSSEAILTFDTSFYFCNGGYGEIWLSFNSGNPGTYTVKLDTVEGYDLDSTVGGTTTTGVELSTGPGNKCLGTTKTDPNAPRLKTATVDLGAYAGLSGLRIMFVFNGSTTDCGIVDDTTFPDNIPNDGNCKSNSNPNILASGWLIDNVGFAYAQVDDELEWTDEDGTVIQSGTTLTVTPQTPGQREYGVTTLVNGCRTDNDAGTNYVNINTSLAYAGQDYTPLNSECGENALQLNAYDNTRNAAYNFNKGAWETNLYVVPAGLDPIDANNTPQRYVGTGVTGLWSVLPGSTNTSCGSSATFSDPSSPDAIFTADPGTYTLRWMLQDGSGCYDDITVTIVDCPTIDFDGTDDYVTFKNNYNLDNANSPNGFSIEAWVKPNAVNGTRTVFSRKDAGDNTNGYDLSIVNGQVQFNWYNGSGSGSVTTGGDTIGTDRWYQLALTFDGTTYTLYVDGIALGTSAGSAPAATAANIEALLGAMDQAPQNVPTNYYHGWVDELKIWNKAITVEHIRQMMNQEIEASGTDVAGVVIPDKIYGPDYDNNNSEDDLLLWSNLVGYYRMNVACGDLAPYVGVSGRLRNITTSQQQTAPLPYTTRVGNQTWSTDNTWTHFTVWDTPNSNGINGDPIDWNIVSISHNVIANSKDLTLLGLLVNSGELTVTGAGTQDETNTGHGLWVTHYLKLDGILDLIGESQLVQKRYYVSGTTTQYNESTLDVNSGGYLERDQQGSNNPYNYNYWGSPVGPQTVGSNNNPRTIGGIMRDGTNTDVPKPINWTATYTAPDSDPISVSTRWLYAYENYVSNTYAAWRAVGNSNTFAAGLGHIMKGSGKGYVKNVEGTQNYVFVGKPNNSTISTTITAGNDALVGNPYPSAIDANEFILDNGPGGTNSISGSLYFWDTYVSNNTHILRDYEGGYAILNLSGGNEATTPPPTVDGYYVAGGDGSKAPERYIPVGQGFFVSTIKSSTSSTPGGQVIFKNSQRVFEREQVTGTNDGSVFLKPGGSKGKNDKPKPKKPNNIYNDISRLRLDFKTPEGAVKHLLLAFTPDNRATDGIDYGYDAPKFNVFPNDLNWDIENSPYEIQGVGAFDETKQYPLRLTLTTGGEVEISLNTLEGFAPNAKAYIYDSLLGTYTKINNAPFETTLDPGNYLNRYFLTFAKDNALSVADEQLNQIVVNYLRNSKEIYINPPNGVDVNQVLLINMLGQTVKTWHPSNTSSYSGEIKIPVNGSIPDGSYIIKVTTSTGTMNKKVIINQ
ncbi:LamG-like jellyroll fold domain-containing protein [Snuella lapsa]|uniref:HYR domain-containing protein n=1 Tax=Snuella lapsa TaxID=870481 RepID=A0ABP6YMN0_9FLAO